MCACISLHPCWHLVGTAGGVSLDLPTPRLLWQLERWLVGSEAELAGVYHCSPRTAWLNLASFRGVLGQFCVLSSRGGCASGGMKEESDASIILAALHPALNQTMSWLAPNSDSA